MKNRKYKKGFTIVELVIVIGVIGILSAILIPTFVNLTNKANAAREQEEVRNAYVAYSIDAQDGKLYNENDDLVDYPAQGVLDGVLAIDKVAVKRGDNYFTYNTTEAQWKNDGETLPTGATAVGTHTAGYEYNGCFIYKLAA